MLANVGLDAQETLKQMGTTNSVISGSSLLPVLTDCDFTPNDLDIYVPRLSESEMLAALELQGFVIHRTESSSYASIICIARVHWLTKVRHVINLVVVDSENAALAMLYFHSTIVMNFLSTNGLFCAYPDLTLNKMSIPNPTMLDGFSRQRTLRCIEKYQERGIRYTDNLRGWSRWAKHACGQDPNCPTTLRTLHDGHGLFIPLTSHLTPPTSTSEVPLRMVYDGYNSAIWSLGGGSCTPDDTLYHRTFVSSIAVYSNEVRAVIFRRRIELISIQTG